MATSPRASKAASVSSVTTNASGSLSLLPRYTPKPEPAYVSAASAADHVTHRHSHDQFDLLSPTTSPTNDGAIFSEAALNLLNTFLDSLLYNFLAKARGTALSQLRPAITEVLKSKLARDAQASADEELGGFEGDEDSEDDENAGTNGQWSQDWHLEMAFKRMRLRVMVFIRLGDFDDEDEDRFLDDEDEFGNNADKPAQEMNFLVNSPAAVYLASILEHVAEQALTTAGESAYRRSVSRANRRSSITTSQELEGMDMERVIVAEADIEKLAMNPTLGRLWRTWRKNYRLAFGSGGAFSPPASPSPYRGRLGSLNEIAYPPNRFDFPPTRFDEDARRALEHDRRLTPDEIPEGDVTETDIAANIPLPMSDNDIDEIEILGVAIPLPLSENDVDEIEMMGVAVPLPTSDNDVNEIEVPGLAREINDEEELDEAVTPQAESLKRRNSAVFGQSSHSKSLARPRLTRLRSNSTPAIGRLPFFYYFFMPKAEAEDEEESITTDQSEITQAVDAEKLPQSDAKDIMPEVAIGAFPETPVLEVPKAVVEKTTIAPIEEEKDTSAGAESLPTTFDDEKIPVEANTMPVVVQKAGATPAAREDSGHALGEEEVDHAKEGGIVAGVVAGAAALAGAAFATIAGSNNKKGELEDQQLTMDTASKPATREKTSDIAERIRLAHRLSGKNLEQLTIDTPIVPEQPMPVQPMSVSPVVSSGAPSGPVSAISESDKAPHVFPKRSTSYVPTGPIPRSNPDGYAESGAQPEKLVAATGTQHTRNGSAPLAQTKPGYASSTSSQGSGYDLGTVPGSAFGLEKSVKRRSMLSSTLAAAARDDEDKRKSSGSSDHDVEEIGVARTTNERVQSLTSSPRATTPEQRSYYLPGSPKSGPSTSRPGSASKDRPFSGADEPILSRQASASKRNTGPSPLRSVTEVETQPIHNGAFTRDTPHAVPFYHSKSMNDEAQLNKRNSVLSETSEGSRPKSRPPPLNTAFVPTGEAVRPSTAQSTNRRSTSSTPPRGHSAKGSSSRPSDESRRKDFDSLLKEGETVKYTLTPDGLRESDPFRPTSSHLNRASALALGTAAIDRGPPSPRIISTPSSGRRPSAHEIATAAPPKSEPTTKVTVISQPTIQPPPQKKGYVPRVSEFRKSMAPRSLTSRPEPMNTNTRKSGFLPREPRVMTDDTRDFADFMRSTKPTTEPVLVPLIRSPSDPNLLKKAKAQAVQPPRPFSQQKLVARAPDVRGGGSTDLIDFIREGPPSAHRAGDHRIPRTVAPFRSTADSDDLKTLGSIVENGNTTTAPMTSKTSRTTGAAPTSALSQNGRAGPSSSGSSMPPIVRKSRRVKDPYAIDSDDEDDYLTPLPSTQPQQKEESLADFLRNTEPPKANAPVTPVSRTQGIAKSSAGGPVRSSSVANSTATSMMSKMKFEARPAGATKSGFGGNGFHYSTNDMADFLRSSGPVEAYAVSPEVPLNKKPSKRGFSRGRG